VLFLEGMALLAYSPLAGGLLTGKYAAGTRPPQSRYARYPTLGARFRRPIVEEVAGLYAGLAREHGLTPVELALGYVRSRWYLGAMIVGASSVAQLDENLAAATTVLDPETVAAIARLQERFPSPAA
jgi:aryl-alcohol dehydrogenase-like predicted oxidoreductase